MNQYVRLDVSQKETAAGVVGRMRVPSVGPTRSATLINGIGQLRRTRGGPALPRVAVQSATERTTAPPRLTLGLKGLSLFCH